MQPSTSNDSNKKTFWNHATTYGLYIGLAGAIITLLSTIINSTVLSVLFSILKFAATLGLLVMAVKKFRDLFEGGYISFNKAFSIGVATSLIATAVQVVAVVVIFIVFPVSSNPELMDSFEQAFSAFGIMDYDMLDMIISYFPYIQGVSLLFWGMFIGVIYSLILGASLKKEKPFFE